MSLTKSIHTFVKLINFQTDIFALNQFSRTVATVNLQVLNFLRKKGRIFTYQRLDLTKFHHDRLVAAVAWKNS